MSKYLITMVFTNTVFGYIVNYFKSYFDNKIKYLETQLLFTQNSLSELQNKLSDIENEYSLKTSALIESTVDLNVKLQDYISHNYEVI